MSEADLLFKHKAIENIHYNLSESYVICTGLVTDYNYYDVTCLLLYSFKQLLAYPVELARQITLLDHGKIVMFFAAAAII